MSKKSKKRAYSAPALIFKASDFSQIDRIWAEMGIIRALRKLDGKVINMNVKTAALRAVELNKMADFQVREEDRRTVLRLVEEIINACREAQRQMASPDKRTTKMQNVLMGRHEDGTPIRPSEVPDVLRMNAYLTRFHTLQPQEVHIVLHSPDYPTVHDQELIMSTIHQDRLRKMVNAPY